MYSACSHTCICFTCMYSACSHTCICFTCMQSACSHTCICFTCMQSACSHTCICFTCMQSACSHTCASLVCNQLVFLSNPPTIIGNSNNIDKSRNGVVLFISSLTYDVGSGGTCYIVPISRKKTKQKVCAV